MPRNIYFWLFQQILAKVSCIFASITCIKQGLPGLYFEFYVKQLLHATLGKNRRYSGTLKNQADFVPSTVPDNYSVRVGFGAKMTAE